MSRRNAERAARIERERRSDNARDVGIRPGVARALGLEERSTEAVGDHDTIACDVFGCADCIAIANGRRAG